ncbi:DUF2218 domain-containing protein [Paracoccus sp. (in: a-proteobacteria)]|uniref:DUF2218 domain-containing protein n=1 Tax=Paracoccus sp. TaxID=267 RepID=UPI0035AEBF51
MQDHIQTSGRFATPNGVKYLTQLCKHFGHKNPAEVAEDGSSGEVRFAMGQALMQADGQGLTATLRGEDQAALDQLRHIIDDHLKRFAFREGFEAMDWAA